MLNATLPGCCSAANGLLPLSAQFSDDARHLLRGDDAISAR
jgi:hypothetical protein